MTSVLVVDDRDINRQLVQVVLTYEGYLIIEAASGAEAFEMVQQSAPDVVVTDVFMPDIDGYALARLIRSNPATADIPIVFYTAAYLGGANEPPADLEQQRVVAKTGDLRELIEAIEDALSAA